MEKLEQLYEGKAKKVYRTDDPNLVIVDYKDDATAFNGLKKGTITGKGAINNQLSNALMVEIEAQDIPTHYVQQLSDTATLVKKVEIVPLEVIIRNKACGSFSKRYGVEEGAELLNPTLEYSLKNDDLGDPLINDTHALALGLVSKKDLDTIADYAYRINEILKEYFAGIGIELIDFKLEFGKDSDGNIVLADEISPDTCRFWDLETHDRLDKDRFRRDLADPEGAYKEVFARVKEKNNE